MKLLALPLCIGLACVAGRAWPQDAAAWGRGDMGFFTVRLVPGVRCPLEVRAHNVLTASVASPTFANLVFANTEVGVRVDHGYGDLPDVVTVTAPDGWIAIPESISLDEDASGIVEVCMAVGS